MWVSRGDIITLRLDQPIQCNVTIPFQNPLQPLAKPNNGNCKLTCNGIQFFVISITLLYKFTSENWTMGLNNYSWYKLMNWQIVGICRNIHQQVWFSTFHNVRLIHYMNVKAGSAMEKCEHRHIISPIHTITRKTRLIGQTKLKRKYSYTCLQVVMTYFAWSPIDRSSMLRFMA